jgi:hypothetical protein
MRSYFHHPETGLCLFAALLAPAALLAITPPPEPRVAPLIPIEVLSDADWNRIDDGLETRLREARRRGTVEELEAMVSVETVFTRPISQQEIDAFLALGGEIDFVFRAVSYGWNGRLPLSAVEQAAQDLGDNLVVIHGHQPLELFLQSATTNSGARAAWSGTPLGLSGNRGNATTRIAILDTGISSTHTDLDGRNAFWKDYTPDNALTPIDILGHGTHVAGIALGSGDSLGGANAPNMTLRFTASGNLTGTATGASRAYPIEFRPGRTYSVSHQGLWNGGGNTSVGFIGRAQGSTGNFSTYGPLSSLSSPYAIGPFDATVPSLHALQPYLPQRNPATITTYAQTVTINNYHAPNDAFPATSGVAPLSEWIGAKIFTNAGVGTTEYLNAALDDLIVMRETHTIRVANMSLGVGGSSEAGALIRAKVNTLALNGIVPVVAVGNDGPGTGTGDLGRTAYAITVGATNSINQLTSYSQTGPTTGLDESMDYKPDLVAPGGSLYYSFVLSTDTNDSDAASVSFADQQPNDLEPRAGTSMAAPMVAGAAALVMESLERTGYVWSTVSSDSVFLLKALLTATATETNQPREVGLAVPPTLQRATTSDPIPYPGKDRVEGYGSLNIGAAVQAVENSVAEGTTNDNIRLANSGTGPRAWAARVSLTEGEPFTAQLDLPGSHDMDLHLYAWLPDANGNPDLLASSTSAGSGISESLEYTPLADGEAILVVKCIAGTTTDNAATLTIGEIPPPVTLIVEQISSPAPGLFGIDAVIPIDVTFNLDDVAVEPPAALQLNTNAAATFDSMTAGNTARFLYTVAEGDEAATLAYSSLDALGPAEAFSSPSATPPPDLTLPAFFSGNDLAASSVVIDGIRPAVTTINLLDPTTTDLDEVRFEVVLSEPLSELPDLDLVFDQELDPIIGGTLAIGDLPATTFHITVILGDPDANGEVSLSVGTANPDAAANAMAAETFSSPYTIQNVPVDPVPDFISVH